MSDDERVTLKEHFDAKMTALRADVEEITARLKAIEGHLAGVVTWRSLAFALTTAATIVTCLFLVIGGK